ncbi:SET domain-containing protein 3-like [Sitodiplosis mosellana]|uniref:SET domain-containing protein 3-like n=1 Tax=Sitodiplosis mosellana TaxID=263140 RepID=UPI0024448ECC|nr:SET domain-containing protein 3-like [Sitodiplosis mosellana]
MDNLWKKETSASDARYVDLFASLPENRWNDFQLDLLVDLVKTEQFRKNNQMSTEFRMHGNGLFRSNDWLSAIGCYNQSLCFAEIGSENVALAYANRSACWFHLHKYNEVLIDIELALNSNLPVHLKPKLEKRKQQSLELRQPGESLDIPQLLSKYKLSYEASKNFPCMADVLEIRCNEEFGRYLAAKCDIPVGKIVLSEENFVASIPDKTMLCQMLCHACLLPNTNPVACAHCSSALFCGVDCMDRNQTHKWECGTFFARLDDTKFVIKTILVAVECFGSVEELMAFVESALLEDPMKLPESMHDSRLKYHFFFKLKTLPPPWDCETTINFIFKAYKQILNMPNIAAVFDSEEKKRFLMHLIGHHHFIRNGNGVSLGEGVSITNVTSILNHSCAPNVFECNIARKKFFVTCRPIKKDEQLYFSYHTFDQSKTLEQRQNLLKSAWNFICKCERCNPTNKPVDRQIIMSDPCYKFVLENQGVYEKNAIVMENCIKFLNEYGRSPWSEEIQFVTEAYESAIQLSVFDNKSL